MYFCALKDFQKDKNNKKTSIILHCKHILISNLDHKLFFSFLSQEGNNNFPSCVCIFQHKSHLSTASLRTFSLGEIFIPKPLKRQHCFL